MTALPEVVFWGGTGHARVLREALQGRARLVAVFDNRAISPPFEDVPVFLGEPGLQDWLSRRHPGPLPWCCIAVGGGRGVDRLALTSRLVSLGFDPAPVVHARAFVAQDALVGPACHVLAQAAVCAGARLQDAVIVNTSASVDHDCVLEAGVHIGPGATLAGEVRVGTCAFVGSGATVLPRITIGAHATIGAGAVVIRDVPAGAIVVGNPARSITPRGSDA